MQSNIFTTSTPRILCALALGLAAIGNAQAQNLLVNGGFETGDLTGWSTELFGGFAAVTSGGTHSGTYKVGMSSPVETGNSAQITQSFATLAGAQYQLSFWSANNPGSGSGPSFGVFVNGESIPSFVDTNVYALHTFAFTASSTTSSISFLGGSFFGVKLDDVSVTAAVPEPSQWALMGLGLAAIGIAARRQRSVKS